MSMGWERYMNTNHKAESVKLEGETQAWDGELQGTSSHPLYETLAMYFCLVFHVGITDVRVYVRSTKEAQKHP